MVINRGQPKNSHLKAWSVAEMRLFHRKSSKDTGHGNTDGNGDLDTRASQSSSIRSPSITQPPNGSAFTSPSVSDITLPAPPDPKLDPAAYLRSIYAVRERTRLILNQAKRNRLIHFDVDLSKFRETAAYVVSIINVRCNDHVFRVLLTMASREIISQIIMRSLLTVGGNISKWAGDPG